MNNEDFLYEAYKIGILILGVILISAWIVGVTWYFEPVNGQKIVSPSVIERLPVIERDLVQAKVIKTHEKLTEVELSNIDRDYKHMSKAEKLQIEAASTKIP